VPTAERARAPRATSSRSSAALVGSLCYLFASVFWGLNIPLTAELLKGFDPFWLTLCRYVVAASLLGTLVAASLGPRALRSPIGLPRVMVLGLCVSAFLVCFTVGLMLTHPVTAAAVIAGSPVYVAAVSRIMTRAPFAKGFVPATVLTVLGAGIAIAGRSDAGLSLKGGEVLIVGSLASWTIYSILAQRWFEAPVPQLRRTWLSSVAAIPWLLAFWLVARATGVAGEPNLSPDARSIVFLLATAMLSTALSTVAWNIGVSRLGIAVGGLWQNTVPVFAVLISLVFFGVVPTGAQVLGGAVVLCGVAIMQWHSIRAARAAARAGSAAAR
jgi:drug/metabolite transporter (DMT)-like permease